MIFKVLENTDNYVALMADEQGVELLGNKDMVEYVVKKAALQIKSVNNISQAHVKFVFQRRIEYHITGTITQTFILVIVGYLSLFFELENFTDRIMVVLTTMLVIATITSSVQQVRTYTIIIHIFFVT